MFYSEEIDISSAQERFMGNEALYKKFLFQLPEKNMMEELENCLADKNAEEAFKVAHTMKGVVGNLSLYKLMKTISEIVEVLRNGKLPGEEQMYLLKDDYYHAVTAISEVKDNDITLFN